MDAFRLTSLPFFAQTWGGAFIQFGCPTDMADGLGELPDRRGWFGLTVVAVGASFTITRSDRDRSNDVSEADLGPVIRSFADHVDVVDALVIGAELGALGRYAARLDWLELRPRIVALAGESVDLSYQLQQAGYAPVADSEVWSIFCRMEDVRKLPLQLKQPLEAEIGWFTGRESVLEAELLQLHARLSEASDQAKRLGDELSRCRRHQAGEISRLRNTLGLIANELSIVSAAGGNARRDSELVLLATRQQAELGAAQIFEHRFRRGRLFRFLTRRRTDELLGRRRALVLSSGLFDAPWYLHRNSDVAEKLLDPMSHFVDYGSLEGRDPGPGFNTQVYLRVYPDVASSRVEPFMHYLIWGRHERRLDWRLEAG